MTAAIGSKAFDASTMQSDTGGRGQARPGEASAFRDVLNEAGKRNADSPARRANRSDAAPDAARSGPRRDEKTAESETASPAASRHAQEAGHHPHRVMLDRLAEGERKEQDEPSPAAPADGASPLRDRMPLLTTLHELRHRGAEDSAPAPADRSGGRNDAAKPKATETAPQVSAISGDGEAGDMEPASRPGPSTKREDVANFLAQRHTADPASKPVTTAGVVAAPAGTSAAPHLSKDAEDDVADKRTASSAPRAATPLPAATDGAPSPASSGNQGNEAGSHATPDRRETARERENAPRAGAERSSSISVIADRSFPAPAAHPLSPTTAGVIDALAAARHQALSPAVSLPQPQPAVAPQAHMLRIELHPAELGVVIASLRMAGEQLSVELRPETAEAYRRLSNDSDTIASSLKKLGLDVDTVTVMQPSIAATPAARADAGNQATAMPGRDASQFQSGTPGGGGDNSGGRQLERNRGHEGHALERPAPAHRDRAGGALFI